MSQVRLARQGAIERSADRCMFSLPRLAIGLVISRLTAKIVLQVEPNTSSR
jgi:hypothetical protein